MKELLKQQSGSNFQNNTEIELMELDCIAQVSGLRGYNEEEQIVSESMRVWAGSAEACCKGV
ncbi:MAG: hypothetical protein Ct9H300mP28_34250 [Pseudomonadota bacterium]|nr:MAG: hypothetical protein Ct9H300mP28_34250 [Pseudomonadota bacterium]